MNAQNTGWHIITRQKLCGIPQTQCLAGTIHMLFVDVIMRYVFGHLARVPTNLRSQLIGFAGLIVLFTLLGLWVAMTAAIFKFMLGLWCVAILFIYVLVWTSPDERI